MVTELFVPDRRIVVPKPPSYIRGDWRLRAGSGLKAYDWSRYRNHADITDATWTASGKHGAALTFAQTGYVDCGTDLSLNPTQAITLMAWVKPSAMTGSPLIREVVARGTYGGVYPYSLHFYVGVGWEGRINNGSSHTISYTPDEEWHHIAFTYNRVVMTVYLDGEASDLRASTDAIDEDEDEHTYIGNEGSLTTRGLTGVIDEAQVLGLALSVSEIKSYYNATK